MEQSEYHDLAGVVYWQTWDKSTCCDAFIYEVKQAASRRMPNGVIQSEIIDLILVAAMLHERLVAETQR